MEAMCVGCIGLNKVKVLVKLLNFYSKLLVMLVLSDLNGLRKVEHPLRITNDLVDPRPENK